MSRFLSYTFPAGNTTDICQAQSPGAAATLVLNGNLVNSLTGTVSFLPFGYSRSISITSAADTAGRTFTVTGAQNGVSISENITGPNNTTVYSTQIYDTITSITVNGAAADVIIGTGPLGFFPLIGINLERDVINYSLTLAQLAAGNIPYSVYGTLSNIVNNGRTYLQNIANNYNLIQIQAFETENNYIYNYGGSLYSSLLVYLGQDGGSITYSTQMNFRQT